MYRKALALAVLTACYRDSAPSVHGEAVAMQPAACSGADDWKVAPLDRGPGTRLRSHVDGPLSGADRRTWAGEPIPRYIDRRSGARELFVLDDADGGFLAFYREPYDMGSCPLSATNNCSYEARFYKSNRLEWSVRLDEHLSRRDHLEIQDIRLADGILYFNEACQSYAEGAGRQCSSLVAFDPRAKRVLWRTDHLVSNNRFLVRGCFIVAGYGFTSEPDFVHLVDRATGKVAQRIRVASAPQQMTLRDRDHLDVQLYSGGRRRFKLVDIDRKNGALEPLDPPDLGGAAYGGMGYGGAAYGGVPRRPIYRPIRRPLRQP